MLLIKATTVRRLTPCWQQYSHKRMQKNEKNEYPLPIYPTISSDKLKDFVDSARQKSIRNLISARTRVPTTVIQLRGTCLARSHRLCVRQTHRGEKESAG